MYTFFGHEEAIAPFPNQPKDRHKTGEKVHPLGDMKADEVTGDRPDDNLDESDRYRNPDRNERGEKRQPQPKCRLKPNGLHRPAPIRKPAELRTLGRN